MNCENSNKEKETRRKGMDRKSNELLAEWVKAVKVAYYPWFPLQPMAGPLHVYSQRTQTPDSVSQGWDPPELWLWCLLVLSFLQPLQKTGISMWSGSVGHYPGPRPNSPQNWCQWHLWSAGLEVNQALRMDEMKSIRNLIRRNASVCV